MLQNGLKSNSQMLLGMATGGNGLLQKQLRNKMKNKLTIAAIILIGVFYGCILADYTAGCSDLNADKRECIFK